MRRIGAVVLGIGGIGLGALALLFFAVIQQFSAWGAGGADYLLPLVLLVVAVVLLVSAHRLWETTHDDLTASR